MKFFFIFFNCLLNFIFCLSLEDKQFFLNTFSSDIDKANLFISKHKNEIVDISEDYNIDVDLFISIMFPELVRYNHLEDQLQVSANKLFYIQLGSEYADFSIGILQMKPSFIERLSNTKKRDRYNDLFDYADNLSNRDIRGIIIDRLQDINYQFKYLAYFVKIIDTGNEFEFKNENEKVIYYATAYNSGAWYNEENNKIFSERKTYPYGANSSEIKQYSYSDISLYYYENILNK